MAAKILLASALILGLLVGAGHQMFPTVALSMVLLKSAIGLVSLLLAVAVGAFVVATWQQFLLRHGATDTQWFWFRSEPPGLTRLREQAARQQDPH
jgi:hypothetical protein